MYIPWNCFLFPSLAFVSCNLFQLPLLGSITFVTGCKPSLLAFLQGDGTETKNPSVPVMLQRSFWQSLTFPIADSFLETISQTCMDNLVNRQSALVLHLTIMLWLFASMSRKVTYHLPQLLSTTSSLLTTSFFSYAFQIVSHFLSENSLLNTPSKWHISWEYSSELWHMHAYCACRHPIPVQAQPLATACRRPRVSSGPASSQSILGKQKCNQ